MIVLPVASYSTFFVSLAHEPFVHGTVLILCALITIICLSLIWYKKKKRVHQDEFYSFISILITSTFLDITAALQLLHTAWNIGPAELMLLLIRCSWIAFFIQYQALGYLTERLSTNHHHFRWWHRVNWCITVAISIFFLCSATIIALANIEAAMLISSKYYLYSTVIINISIALWRLRYHALPRIITQQLQIFILFFVTPYLLLEVIQAQDTGIVGTVSGFSLLSYGIFTIALLMVTRRLLAVRFLNTASTIITGQPLHTQTLNKALESLSHATTAEALQLVTQQFLYDQFGITADRIVLTLEITNSVTTTYSLQQYIADNEALMHYLQQHKIVVLHDIEYDAFKKLTPVASELTFLMQRLQADVILPLFASKQLLGHISIMTDDANRLYKKCEQDLMMLYSRYLSSFVPVLELQRLQEYKFTQQQLVHRIHEQQQRLHNLQESFKTFIQRRNNTTIGLLLYKNRHFIIGNQEAHEIIPFNLNLHEGDPVTKDLRSLARLALQYRKEQQGIITIQQQRFYTVAIPLLDTQQIIIIMYAQQMTDLLQQQLNTIPHAENWEYLLYLATTTTGKLINQLLPSDNPSCTAWKIAIARGALSLQPLLIQVAQEDVAVLIELIHHCSQRRTLERLTVRQPTTPHDFITRLAGINKLFGKNIQEPLLRSCHQGTLCIENIEFLDSTSQEYIVAFIRTGYYKPYKSGQLLSADIRILLVTQQSLQALWQAKKIIEPLYQLLTEHSVIIPSLQTIADRDLQELILALATQNLPEDFPHKKMPLTPKELARLLNKQLGSIEQLRVAVHQTIMQKFKFIPGINYHLQHIHDTTPHIHDPELIEIAKLGKHALKDKQLMTILWQKFNNQNKIATFLRVNRSSVNRRCKEFNLV